MTIQLNLGYSVISVAPVANQSVHFFINFCWKITDAENNAFTQAHNCAKVEKRIHEDRFSLDSVQTENSLGARKN